jgi:hypothetical protein
VDILKNFYPLSLITLFPDRNEATHVNEAQDDDNHTCHHHYHALQEVGPYNSLYSALKYQIRTVFNFSAYFGSFLI